LARTTAAASNASPWPGSAARSRRGRACKAATRSASALPRARPIPIRRRAARLRAAIRRRGPSLFRTGLEGGFLLRRCRFLLRRRGRLGGRGLLLLAGRFGGGGLLAGGLFAGGLFRGCLFLRPLARRLVAENVVPVTPELGGGTSAN